MNETIEQVNWRSTVRRAGAGDARLLAQLGARLFEQAFGAANDPDDMRSYLSAAFSIESATAELADAYRAAWIAEDAGRAAVGYAVLRRGPDASGGAGSPSPSADGVTGAKPAELQRLYVDQPWHGRGVAAALMSACLEQANAWHRDVIWLGVWERNPRAIAFYEKSGFQAVGSQNFILGRDVQRDVIMARAVR